MSHTPGPWKVTHSDRPQISHLTISSDACEHLAAVISHFQDGGNIPYDTFAGNAYLIAAAPELLEALKKTIALFYSTRWKQSQMTGELIAMAGQIAMACDVVAKAEGIKR